MVVRLTRLATGKVIGDLLARSIVPVTEDVREKIRTMNQVAMNMVTVIEVRKMQLESLFEYTSARSFIRDMELFSPNLKAPVNTK